MVRQLKTKNDLYQKFETLKRNRQKRYACGEFFVEGVRNLNYAVQDGWEISHLLYTSERPLSDWAKNYLQTVKTICNYDLPAAFMAELSGKTDASELLAVVKMRPDTVDRFPKRQNPLFVLFDRPSNHGNLGTILRSCDSFGVDGLLITGHAVDLYDPEVIGASMGSFFHLPTVRMPAKEQVLSFIATQKAEHPNFLTVGTTAHRQHPIDTVDLRVPLLWMIGNETDGLCRAFKEICDIQATIPMAPASAASSFNVACAATVMLYETVRQRGR